MDLSVIATSFVILFIINMIWNRITSSKTNQHRMPPSPSRLPLIGNIQHLIGKKMAPHQVFTSISKDLGPLFTFWFGDSPVVFVNDYFMAKKLLLSCECSGRPQRAAGKTISRNFQGVIVTDACPALEKRRGIIHQALNFNENGNMIENLRLESKELVKYIHNKLEKTNIMDITERLALSANNIFMKLLFNKRFTSTNGTFATVQQLLMMLMKGLTLANLFEGFPALRKIPLGRFMFLDVFVKGMFDLIGKEYDSHITASHSNKKADLTDFLIAEKDSLSRENVEVLLSDTLVSSIDTTVNALNLVVYNLTKFKDVAVKCRQEITETLGDEPPSLEGIGKCHYIRAFVYESLRTKSIAPLGVPHKTTTDVYVDGYTIPKNTTVFFNIDCIHNEDSLFEKPECFNVERFLDDQGKFQNVEGFMGFSIGRRNCLGQSYATKSLMFFIAEILKHFELDAPNGEEMADPFTYETTLKVNPYLIKLSKRDNNNNKNNNNKNNKNSEQSC